MLSPCVKICDLNPITNNCNSCKRSLEHIINWAKYTDAERKKIVLDLKKQSNRDIINT